MTKELYHLYHLDHLDHLDRVAAAHSFPFCRMTFCKMKMKIAEWK